MDAPKYQKNDPAILLLNEIDILLAQTRLMELYLKQAQATAVNENARIHEQYETQLATLRADLADKERQLQQRPVIAVEPNLSETIGQLQRELSAKQQILSRQEVTFQHSTSEITALQGRIAQLEADNSAVVSAARGSNAIRESLAADVAALNQELETNRRELHHQQLAARELENGLREQLRLLQNQVADNQAYAFSADDKLGKAQQEIAALHQHLGSLQAIQDELQSSSARELEQTRGRFESELASLRSALAERDRSVLQNQIALLEIERGLRSEIDILRNDLEQRQAALGLRDKELRAAGAQIAALQQRVADLEMAHRQATDATAKIDTLRRSLAEEVANLQHEVEVKEKELTQRYEAVTAVELALHGRIQALQQELARAHEASNAQEVELQNHAAESAALQSRIAELERSQADTSSIGAARQQLESDLNRLRTALGQKEYLLAQRERASGELEAGFSAEIATLHQQLEQERTAAARTHDELLQARSELAASREQLEAQLSHKDDELNSLRASATEQSEQLSNQVNDLQHQLAERETTVANLEARLGVEIAALHQQLEQERSSAAGTYHELLKARGEFTASREQLEAQLSHKDHELGSLRASATEQSEQLSQQVNDLQHQVAERETTVANLEARLGVEIAALHQQLEQERSAKATANDELARFQTELTTTRERFETQLTQKDQELASLRASATGQTEHLSNRIDELQSQLAEKQLLAETHAIELDYLRTSVTQLNEQLSEKAANHAQALGLWQDSQAQHSTEIAQLTTARDELLSSQAALKVELDQAHGANAGLRGELQESRDCVAELEALLKSSQTAMAVVAAERAQLRSELENLDALHNQTKADAAREIAQGRDALESELSALRNELQQKAWSLAQHQASVENLAQIHREQMRKQEARLSEQQPVIEQQARELDQALTRANGLQRQVEELRGALQQAQAAGASQAEQIRQEYAARLETVNSLLAIKSAEMANSDAVRANVEASLRGELSRLHSEIQSRTSALQSREDELNRVRAEMTSVQNRLVQLESVSARTESEAREISQAKSGLESELAALRNELHQGSSAVAHQQAAMDDLAARHRSQVEQLEANLSEQHGASEEHRREVDRAQAQLTLLHRRIEELQSTLQQTEVGANSRTEQLRQEYAARVDTLKRELVERSAELQDRAGANSDSEQALRSEIDRLIGEAQERNHILQSRNDELVRVKNDLDSLAERFSQLESHAVHAQSNASGEAESMRSGFQAQLALLQAELSQKEWALEERQAIIAGIEQEHRQQLDALRQQLAEEEQSAIPADNAFVMGDPNLTEPQREKLLKLDDMVNAIRSSDNVRAPAPSGRRWQSGFGWKRRWRS
ncbi:MAG: hypothetical protein ACXW6J_00655 [Candidatus Binatia bacterium]